jgi:hypothetical protein
VRFLKSEAEREEEARLEAERLARDLRVRLVAPLDGLRRRDLHGAHLVLVLGSR